MKKTPLSKLDEYLKEAAKELLPIQPDEFTVEMLMDRMKAQGGMTLSHCRLLHRLAEDVASGRLTVRKLSIGGKQRNVYKP
tara:strand:- start:18 stop:260 length:243 start_codon:yes stop_codon:yes gene_type:complete